MKTQIPRLLIVSALLSIIYIGPGCGKSSSGSTKPPVDSSQIVDLKKGLLLYLPFEGNMADSSGNGNITTPVAGAALTYDEHGNSNSAFGGTGNGERIVVTNNGSIQFDTAYSISLDFMIRSFGYQSFISMVAPVTGYGPSFITGIVGNYNPTQQHLDFGAPDTTLGCNSYGTVTNGPEVITQFIPQPESWYNLIAIFHKGVAQLYVNGKLIGTQTGTVPKANFCTASKVVIGGWWDGGPISINGKLDEVRLYNRVLNTNEIAELSKSFQGE
jgi:hypothetical protein